jgi:hypothetical protein
LKKCKDCASTNVDKSIVKAVDSHNNLVEYHCLDCNCKSKEIVAIDEEDTHEQ